MTQHCFLFFFSLWLFPLFSQETILSYERYGVEQGLSHRQVNTIFQDEKGFIWLGTEYGLNRFDGYDFKWWTKEENGLFQNKTDHITEDAEGFLWLFYHYSHKTNRFYHFN